MEQTISSKLHDPHLPQIIYLKFNRVTVFFFLIFLELKREISRKSYYFRNKHN